MPNFLQVSEIAVFFSGEKKKKANICVSYVLIFIYLFIYCFLQQYESQLEKDPSMIEVDSITAQRMSSASLMRKVMIYYVTM